MTEAKWLSTRNSEPMLRFIWDKASNRNLRLLAVAIARLFKPRGPELDAVELAERLVEGKVSEMDWLRCRFMLDRVVENYPTNWYKNAPWEDRYAHFAAKSAISGYPTGRVDPRSPDWRLAQQVHSEEQADLVREVFGNPFRPAVLDPSWLTETVQALVEPMYPSKDFSALPILADALEDAGCSDASVLGHCRSIGPHHRGCWVVDLLTGRE